MAAQPSPTGRWTTLAPLFEALAAGGEREALVGLRAEEARRWSYRDLHAAVERLAAGLHTEGVGCGDVVVLFAPPSPEAVVAALATVRAGAVIAPMDVQFEPETVATLLAESGAHLAFTTADLWETVADRAGAVRPVHLDREDGDGWQAWQGEAAPAPPEFEPESRAALFFTSGTTGTPKGVPLSHRNLAFQLAALEAAGVAREGDRVLLPLPIHHVYPFVLGLLAPLALQLTVVFPFSVTGPQVLRALRDEAVTLVIGVPRLYGALLDAIEGRFGRLAPLFRALLRASAAWRARFGGLPGRWLFRPVHRRFGGALRLLASGGAALPPELAARLEGLGWPVAEGYGLTETAPLIALRLPGDDGYEAVGRPVPGCEVRIADAEGAPEGAGEVQVRGPNVFTGYVDRAEETAAAFTGDGWYRTGDLGRLDDHGYLRLLGRVSTLIVTAGGENIQPEVLEAAYAAHPAIQEIGIFQNEQGLVAVVVPATDAGGDPQALQRRIREALRERGGKLPSYQRLADFVISGQPLARTRLGKVRRHLLEARYRQVRDEDAGTAAPGPLPLDAMSDVDLALLEHPEARRTWDWLAQRYHDRPLTPDSDLALDLGVDSLAWLDLTLGVGQRTGIELDDAAIARVQTVRDLLNEVVEAGQSQGGRLLDDPEAALDAGQRRWLQPLGPIQARFSHGLYGLDRRLLRRWFALEVEGLENLPEGACLLAPNHGSYLDPPALAAALGPDRCADLYWGGWTGVVFSTAVRRYFSRLARIVPVDPERGAVSSLALAAAVLKNGHPLVWFPEGGRSLDGALQPLRPGVGLLLAHRPVPVVPVAIHGAWQAWPPRRRWPRRHPVRVVFGRPLDPEELERGQEGDNAQSRITAGLGAALERLLAESRRD